MRAVLLLLILLVVGVIAAVATGFISINQTQPARAPDIAATRDGIAAEGGQPPKFQVETGQVAIGKGEATVPVPRIEVRPADGDVRQAPQQQTQQQQQQQQGANAAPAVATTNATQP